MAERETAELAKRFLEETIRKHGIQPGQLDIHADRGSAPAGAPKNASRWEIGEASTLRGGPN